MKQSRITAERRSLNYEDYLLPHDKVRNLWEDSFCLNDPVAIDYIHNLCVSWVPRGKLGLRATFEAPDGTAYKASMCPPWGSSWNWDVEIMRVQDEVCMRRDDIYCDPAADPAVSFQDVAGVLKAASCILLEAEDNGYP